MCVAKSEAVNVSVGNAKLFSKNSYEL